MRKVLGIIASVFAVFFSVPTGLILASWNALPGDTLYTTKRALENVTLTVVQSTPLASSFSVSFTDRRFNEADKLLSTKGSTIGYSLLVEQAQQSKEIIVDQKNTQQADQLIQNIDQYEKLIETKKAVVVAQAQQQAVTPSYTQSGQPQPTYTNPPQTGTTTQTQTTQPVYSPSPTTATTQPGVTTPSQTQTQQPTQVLPSTQPAQQPSQIQQESVQQTLAQLNDAQQHLERIKNEIKRDIHGPEREDKNQNPQNSSPQEK